MKIIKLSETSGEKGSHGDYLAKELIKTGAFPPIHSFGQVTLKPGQESNMHGHGGNFEIFLVLKGKMKIVFGEGEEKECDEGTCVITEENEKHAVSNPYQKNLEMLYLTVKSK